MFVPKPPMAASPHLIDPAQVPKPLRWEELFGNTNPVELEIGSGKGLFLANAAAANPQRNFLGIEIAKKYAGLAAQRISKKDLTNVKIWAGDAKPILAEWISPRSLQAVHVYFPDPWWKKRHKKRRVFTSALLDDILRLLTINGELSVASDVEEYYQVIRELVASRPQFRELPVDDVRDPEHELDYLTNFERKFRIEGRSIYRARYELVDIPQFGEAS